MADTFEDLQFIKPWPSIVDDWIDVHARFGMAVQASCELETGLLMLLSQAQQIRGREFGIDRLILKLEKNGELSLGRLVSTLNDSIPLPSALLASLQLVTNKRNFLIHHFYRHHSSGFFTQDGCRSLVNQLLELREDFEQAVGELKEWSDDTLGTVPRDILRDHVLEDLDNWKSAQQSLYQAMLGKKHAI